MSDDADDLRELLGSPEAPSWAVIRHQRETLMNHIQASDETSIEGDSLEGERRGKRRGRGRTAALVVGPIVAVGLTAAAWQALRPAPASESLSFACVSPEVDQGTTTALRNDGSDPVAACAALWRSGDVVPGITEAPDLVACLHDGYVQVRQGSTKDACRSLGLAPGMARPSGR